MRVLHAHPRMFVHVCVQSRSRTLDLGPDQFSYRFSLKGSLTLSFDPCIVFVAFSPGRPCRTQFVDATRVMIAPYLGRIHGVTRGNLFTGTFCVPRVKIVDL